MYSAHVSGQENPRRENLRSEASIERLISESLNAAIVDFLIHSQRDFVDLHNHRRNHVRGLSDS